jgi:hypothetical protein
MYNVTLQYEEAAKKSTVIHFLRGSIGSIAFTEAAILEGSFEVNNQICDSSKIKFGGVFVGELHATFIPQVLNGAIPRGSWIGKVITFEVGTQLEDLSIEWVPGGVFTIAEVNHTLQGIEVTAYDAMTKFDRRYNGRVFGGSLSLVVDDLAEYLGLTVNYQDSSFPDPFGTVKCSLENSFETWRDYFSSLLESRACYSYIDRNGLLVVRSWSDFVGDEPSIGRSEYELTTAERFDNISVSDWSTLIFGASITTQETGELHILGGQSDEWSFYEFGDNPFMQDSEAVDRFTDIYNNIISKIYITPYTVETNSEIALDFGDYLYLPDGLGDFISSPVMGISYVFRHSTTYQAYGENPAKSSSSGGTSGSGGAGGGSYIGNKIAFYYQESQSSFDIETTDRQIVNSIDFLADTDSEANTWTEIKGTISKDDPDTPVTVKVVYFYDDNMIEYSPEFTFNENGYQTLSLNYFLDYIDPSIGHTWDVALEVSGGSFQIDNHEVHTLIWGQGLSKVDKWDGKIKLSDELALYLLKYQPLVLKAITDSADVDFYTSEVPAAADQFGRDLYRSNNIGNMADYVIITVGEPDVNNIFFTGEDYAGDPISTGLI